MTTHQLAALFGLVIPFVVAVVVLLRVRSPGEPTTDERQLARHERYDVEEQLSCLRFFE